MNDRPQNPRRSSVAGGARRIKGYAMRLFRKPPPPRPTLQRRVPRPWNPPEAEFPAIGWQATEGLRDKAGGLVVRRGSQGRAVQDHDAGPARQAEIRPG